MGTFKTYVYISYFWEIQKHGNSWKDGHRKIPKIRLIKSWRSWIWDQYIYIYKYVYQKNMKLSFGESLKLWNFRTNKAAQGPINQETKKTRNQQTKKPRNQEPKKSRNSLPLNMSPTLAFNSARVSVPKNQV